MPPTNPMKTLAEGHGAELCRGKDGRVVLTRQPTAVHLFWLAGAPLIGGFCTFAGLVTERFAVAFALVLSTLFGTLVALRSFVASREERITWTPEGRFVVRRMEGARLRQREVRWDALQADDQGRRVRVATDVSYAPGSQTVTGKPATLRVVLLTPEAPRPSFSLETRGRDIEHLAAAVTQALPEPPAATTT